MNKKNLSNKSANQIVDYRLDNVTVNNIIASTVLTMNSSDLQFDATNISAGLTLSGGNHTIDKTSNSVKDAVQTVNGFGANDNIYAEFTINSLTSYNVAIGFVELMTCGTDADVGTASAYIDEVVYVSDGRIIGQTVIKTAEPSFVYGTGDKVGILKNGNDISWFLNGVFFYKYTYTGSKTLYLTVCDTFTSASDFNVTLTSNNQSAILFYDLAMNI